MTDGRRVAREAATYKAALHNWTVRTVSRMVSESERGRIADRVRDRYANSPFGKGFIDNEVTNVVGTGITPIVSPNYELLGYNSTWSSTYQKTVTNHFENYTKDPHCFFDVQRRQNFIPMQQFAFLSYLLDGAAFFVRVTREEKYKPYMTEWLPIDPYRVATPTDKQKENVFEGVRTDDYGAPISIFVGKTQKYGMSNAWRSSEMQEIPVIDVNTGLLNVLILTNVDNLCEYRKDSILTPLIASLRNVDDIITAVMLSYLAKVSMIFRFHNDQGQPPNPNGDINERTTQSPIGTFINTYGSETIQEIPTPKEPSAAFEAIMKNLSSQIGIVSGKGGSLFEVSYNNNFSSAKAELGVAAMRKAMQEAMIVEKFCAPIMMAFQYELALEGITDVKSIDHFLQNAYMYTRCDWLPQPEHVIDENKKVNANKTALDSGQIGYGRLYAKQNLNAYEEFERIAKEKAYIQELEEKYDVKLPFYSESKTNVKTETKEEREQQEGNRVLGDEQDETEKQEEREEAEE